MLGSMRQMLVLAAPSGPPVVSFQRTLDNPNAYDTSANDQFGSAVSISSTHAIVGARQEDDAGGIESGKAYVFNLSNGSLLYTFDNPNAYDTSANDLFGRSVAISSTHAIVGANQEDDAGGTSSGKAYVFDLSNGSLLYTFDNPNAYDTSAGDFFGFSVAISSTHAIVGAYQEDDAGGNSSGKAYVFDLSNGSLAYTLDNPTAFGTSAGDFFGFSVAISDLWAIVGAYTEDEASGTGSGKAYVFDLTDGSLAYTFDNPNAFDTVVNDNFGYSVSITDTHAVVGAYNEDYSGGTASGRAYVFDLSDGSLLYNLENPNAYDTPAGDLFGISVSITDSVIVVGASSEDDAGGTGSGKAYVFDLSTGTLLYTLDNPNAYDTSANDQFGAHLAASATHIIAGASSEDDAGGTSSGKAYIYQIS